MKILFQIIAPFLFVFSIQSIDKLKKLVPKCIRSLPMDNMTSEFILCQAIHEVVSNRIKDVSSDEFINIIKEVTEDKSVNLNFVNEYLFRDGDSIFRWEMTNFEYICINLKDNSTILSVFNLLLNSERISQFYKERCLKILLSYLRKNDTILSDNIIKAIKIYIDKHEKIIESVIKKDSYFNLLHENFIKFISGENLESNLEQM